MEWKYKLIFLLVLLCLFHITNTYSQNCISMQYDKNGNRVAMIVHDCENEYKLRETNDIINDEISINNENQELLIYPNPNDGIFYIMSDNDIQIQIFNINGVMIKDEYLSGNIMIDITNNPSGTYLLRIIKGKDVCSKIIVKL